MFPKRPKLTLLCSLVAAIVMCAFAANAGASTPVFFGGSFPVPVHQLDGVCPFELMSGSSISFTAHWYYDSNGVLVREEFFLKEQDTFIGPNGATLVSDPFELNFHYTGGFDADGNPTSATLAFINAIVERVHLPDGSLFLSAGRVDYSADGFPLFVIVPDHGGIHNLDGFCAALAA